MPLPNPKVVEALFESYIASRKDAKWKITTTQLTSKEIDKKTRDKLDTCEEVLLRLRNMGSSISDWADLAYFLYEKDCAEDAKQPENMLGGIFKPFAPYRLLWSTLHATISYINSQIIQEKEFESIQIKLNKDLLQYTKAIEEDVNRRMPADEISKKEIALALIKQKLKALEVSTHYVDSHFSLLKRYDNHVNELQEANFQQYINNVENNARKIIYCDELIASAKVDRSQPKSPVQAQKSSQSIVETVIPKSTTLLVNQAISEVAKQITTEMDKKPGEIVKKNAEVVIDIPPEASKEKVSEEPKLRRSTRKHEKNTPYSPGAKHSGFPWPMTKEEVAEQQRAYEEHTSNRKPRR